MVTQELLQRIAGPMIALGLILAGCNTATESPAIDVGTAIATVIATQASAEIQDEPEAADDVVIEAISAETVPATAVEIAVPTAVVNSAENDDPIQPILIETASTTNIMLSDNATSISGEGASADGNIITISRAGSYSLSGTLSDGQVLVDSDDEAPVYLILNGVNLSNSNTAPLNIRNAGEAVIELAAGSQNVVTDGATYLYADETVDEPNAAVFSDDDLTITGSGTLTINGNYNDGLASKDGLFIDSGTLIVNASDDGIRGKDYVIVRGGNLTVNAEDDGIKADNEEDPGLGYVYIEAGTINLTTGGKGINGTSLLTLDGGTIAANSADDTLHSNGSIIINNGSMTLASDDDAIHADKSITINGGIIDIPQSYEGIESSLITINDGMITLVSSDDGINAADSVSVANVVRGQAQAGVIITINGGTLVLDTGGDGLDSNGDIDMSDGIIIANGPPETGNSGIDYDGTFTISDGFYVAVGAASRAQTASAVSTQNSLLVNFDQLLTAGTLVHIESSDGREVLTFAPAKAYQSLAFSSATLVQGETYSISYGGTISGDAFAGLYQVDGYQGGTQFVELTLNSSVTTFGEVTRTRRP